MRDVLSLRKSCMVPRGTTQIDPFAIWCQVSPTRMLAVPLDHVEDLVIVIVPVGARPFVPRFHPPFGD